MTRVTFASTAFALAFLALTFLVLVLAEQDRPWKRLQARFRDLELEHLRAESEAERRRNGGSRNQLRRELEDARARFDVRRDEARRLEGELRHARHVSHWAARELERLRAHPDLGRAAPGEDTLRVARQRFEERRIAVFELENRLSNLRSDLDVIEGRWSAEIQRIEHFGQRIGELERAAFRRRIPGARGLDPTLAVSEVRPPGIFRSTPAGRLDRLDRCTTCHLGAERAAPDGDGSRPAWPAPFASHPGDLVGDGAAHPVRLFGCTVCHGGNGRATDFSRAGHWPTSEEQEAEWTEKWDFSRNALPRDLILPVPWVEAGCGQCHDGEPRGRRASTARDATARPRRISLELGRRLILYMGCTGCHTADEPVDKQGPPLGRLAAKTTPEWTFHWIAAPRRFRPTTWMPHLFEHEADAARRTAVIRAMVRYLWSAAGAAGDGDLTAAPPEGDVEAGSRLFVSVGCTGCHLLDVEVVRDSVPLERLHGPNLAGTGNKVRAGWLFDWLRDPRSHRPDTPMPDLRLSDDEAADLVAFLMASRDPAWDALDLPRVDAEVRDELVRKALEKELTLTESAARLVNMTPGDKDLYLGKQSLRAYGCHGCHDVPGLEEAPPVAGTFAAIGEDPRRLLSADSTAVLTHSPARGQLSAPDYGMSRREADAGLVSLLSFKPAAVEPWRQARQGERARAEAAGRRLFDRYGCLGCHQLENRGGAIADTLGDRGLRPPDLTSVGSRLRSPWLFAYLHDPGSYARRPWLAVRMPSFPLAGEEANVLVRFFAAHDGMSLLTAPSPKPSKRDLEVGRAVATMLQCNRCHHDSPDAKDLSPAQLTPSYRGSRSRLRPGWVVDWILDPQSRIPGTEMPVTFARNEDGEPDASYLTATIAAPMFNTHRSRLLPLFESEEEMSVYLADARRVAEALRDYLLSLQD